MDDIYQHPVFFECHSLHEEQIRTVENYFRIRRKSGGGDCGSLSRVRDNVYCIAFRHQQDQHRVLQRLKHEPEGGSLMFTVQSSFEPQNPSTTTASTSNKEFTESPKCAPTSSPAASDEEYELQRETYLLRYLNECPKAWNDVQRELTTMACTAQIHPEEGRVVVRSLAQPDAVDKSTHWKSKVDNIFDGYLCHYEMDPRKVKALLQSCSSDQTTDEVKVYSEGGMAVVVGKCSQVNTRLMDLEGSTVKHKESHLDEKQTRVRWLGEAKFRLLWKDINHSLGRDLPGLKVSQDDAGHLVLEGSMKEILGALDCISIKENSVLERTVSNMSPHFFIFLRKVYGGPGVLADVLGFGGEVEIEFRDSELHLFSLCADKLNDAEKALHKEFKEVKMDISNCSAVLDELEEKLKSKTNFMNQGQCKVQVVLISDSTVCLLGHKKEVEMLSETVTQFILNESNVQSTVHLPFPVLAQELPEFLQLHGFDYSGITFHPLTSSYESMVVLEGPSSKVTEVKNRLGPFLDSVVQDRISTDTVGSVRNFQRSIQIDKLPSLTSEENTVVSSYSLCDRLQVLVCQGDITKQDADVLVNAANEDLDHCGGVAAALSKAGGPEVQKESKVLVKQTGKIPTGDVVVTTGGNLKCKKLLHAVGPVGGEAGGRERFLLEKTINSALNLAEMMQFKSIAMPCISSGIFGVPVTVCSEAIVTAVKEFGSHGGRSLSKIILIDNREEVVRAMQEACDKLLQGINIGNCTSSALGFQMRAAAKDTATRRAPENGVFVEITEGTIETQQVDALVSPMVGHDPLSTRVGNTLSSIVGSQLTARFRKQAEEEETMPGDTVLVDDLSGLPSNAVFFLNLIPWDGEQDGTSVQVLRLGIQNILTSCEQRGFTALALPLLGTGIALQFPVFVVARVLLEEINAFEQSRASRTPLLVRVTIHPNDKKSSEDFKLVQEAFKKEVCQPDHGSSTMRVVLLGKTGVGKSNLANTIFAENLFTTNASPNSETKQCQAETRHVSERSITLIDTPGLFDTGKSEEEVKPEIMNCITECAPGPHVFLIVLKVDKFTEQEQDVVNKICKYFSEDALRYAVIVFTHGDQLPKGMKIEEFVRQNKNLSDLVEKCGGRCHVFDNKYWKNKQQNNYRSNQFQVEELLNTIDKMVMDNNGGYYTNEMLQAVEEEIKKEEEHIRLSSGNMQLAEIRKQAKTRVSQRFLIQMAGIATGVLLGAFFGIAGMVKLALTAVKNGTGLINFIKNTPQVGKVVTAAAGGELVAGAGVGLGVAAAVTAAAGGVMGGVIGHDAAEGAETVQEAVEKATKAVVEKAKATLQLQ